MNSQCIIYSSIVFSILKTHFNKQKFLTYNSIKMYILEKIFATCLNSRDATLSPQSYLEPQKLELFTCFNFNYSSRPPTLSHLVGQLLQPDIPVLQQLNKLGWTICARAECLCPPGIQHEPGTRLSQLTKQPYYQYWHI